MVVALSAILFAQDNLKPYSVFVCGYTRSDGTRTWRKAAGLNPARPNAGSERQIRAAIAQPDRATAL